MYSVQFVGLACFLRGQDSRFVMFPDGRNPGDGIEPHYASIVVDGGAVERATGWEDETAVSQGVFALPPCSVNIQTVSDSGTLDTSAHDGRLPELRQIDPNFIIDRDHAETIATIDIRQGTLTAYQIPGGTALISQLDVTHDESIVINVVPRDGSPSRSIQLSPGTEIAIANTAHNGYVDDGEEENGHFRIYERLSAQPVTLNQPLTVASAPPSPSRHPMFLRRLPAGLTSSCSNTGCCSG